MKKKQKQCEKKKDKSFVPLFPQKFTCSVTLVRSLNIEKGFEEFEIIFRGEYVQNIGKKPEIINLKFVLLEKQMFCRVYCYFLFCEKDRPSL